MIRSESSASSGLLPSWSIGKDGWMTGQNLEVLPKYAIGQAIAYRLRSWDKLSVSITDGRLGIDNNPKVLPRL